MTETPKTPEFMSPREASMAFGVPYTTLLRWLRDDTLTRYTKGGGTKLPRLMLRTEQLRTVLAPTPADRVSA